ncbi:hypothetical protein AQUCO_07600115v1 [Aquilegia coerulea]|uniref:Uncharacterized protein n=1 Tax=Aquilegia coerulea TaxID=218851 RepID=A0A2G5C8Y7_AQUCA|nr:hypothetical protein AQUCO_07600115v1 [Aquilegia coerulea]
MTSVIVLLLLSFSELATSDICTPLSEDDLRLFFDSDHQNQNLDDIVGPSNPNDDCHGIDNSFDTFTVEELEHGSNTMLTNLMTKYLVLLFFDDAICANNYSRPLISGEHETDAELVDPSDRNNLLDRSFTIEEVHAPCSEIVAHSNGAVFGGTIDTIQEKNGQCSRDSIGSFDDPIDDRDEQEAGADHVNSDTNAMPLAVWPPEPVPYNCSCCQVLRDIVHSNGMFKQLD